ncbi:MAG TPA: efflux RND transporter periplasmic adaptor subunit [Xanthobacteraceae bacterium]
MNDVDKAHGPQPAESDLPPVLDRHAEQAGGDAQRSHSGARMVGLVASVILAAALGYGAGRHQLQDDEVAVAAERQRDFVPTVRADRVQPTGANVAVTLPATTSAFAAANIYARATGYIAKRTVDIGDHVKAGELLAEITAPELDHQIVQAEATIAQMQAALQQAQANRDLASSNWTRDKPLVEKGWVTPQQGDNDRLTLAADEAAVGVAQANIKEQQAQLKVLQQQKDYQSVVAPFDGVITQRNIDVGDLVQANATSGTFMFAVMRSNVVRIQLYVPQSEAFGLAPGVAAVFRVPEIPDRTFPGRVTRIADALQPGTRTLLTEIDIPNPDDALSPGTYGTVDLDVPRKTPALLVSADAIIFNSQGVHVAVVENGIAHLRQITIARDLGREVEVRDGVQAGDQVILNAPVDLADGAKVHVRPEPPAQVT